MTRTQVAVTNTTVVNTETICELWRKIAAHPEPTPCRSGLTGGTIRSPHVEVSAGEVILLGHTSTYDNKQLATHAALDAASEPSLTNEVEVR